jgi:hypothetical protein
MACVRRAHDPQWAFRVANWSRIFGQNSEQLHKDTSTCGALFRVLDIRKTKRRVLEDFGQRRGGQYARRQTSAAGGLRTLRLPHRTAVLGDLYDRKSNGCDQKHCAKCACRQSSRQPSQQASSSSAEAKRLELMACQPAGSGMLRLMSTMHPRIDPLRGIVSSSHCCTSCASCANLSALFSLDCCVEFGGLIGGDGMVLLAGAR